jgi:hypothetical protein
MTEEREKELLEIAALAEQRGDEYAVFLWECLYAIRDQREEIARLRAVVDAVRALTNAEYPDSLTWGPVHVALAALDAEGK